MGWWVGSCAIPTRSGRALPHPGLAPSRRELPEDPVAGALVVQWAGTSQKKVLLGDFPGPQSKAAPPPLLANTRRRFLPSTAKVTTILRSCGIDCVPAGPNYRRAFVHRGGDQ